MKGTNGTRKWCGWIIRNPLADGAGFFGESGKRTGVDADRVCRRQSGSVLLREELEEVLEQGAASKNAVEVNEVLATPPSGNGNELHQGTLYHRNEDAGCPFDEWRKKSTNSGCVSSYNGESTSPYSPTPAQMPPVPLLKTGRTKCLSIPYWAGGKRPETQREDESWAAQRSRSEPPARPDR